MRTDGVFPLTDSLIKYKIKTYFDINKITKEKLDLIENRTKINLSNYRNRIKKYYR